MRAKTIGLAVCGLVIPVFLVGHKSPPRVRVMSKLEYGHDELRLAGAKLVHSYVYPVAFSPNGRLRLMKRKTEKGFRLEIYTGAKLIETLLLDVNPWELRWAPKGKAIAFIAERHEIGTYSVYLWHLQTDRVETLVGPEMNSAAFALRFSPDGRKLGYVSWRPEGCELVLVALGQKASRTMVSIDDVVPEAGFAWSPDSESVVVVRRVGSASVLQSLGVGRRLHSQFTEVLQGEVRDLSWSPAKSAVMTIREPRDDMFRIAWKAPSKMLMVCPPSDGDAQTPSWTSDGQIEYLLQSNSSQRVVVGPRCGSPLEISAPVSGAARLQDDGYTHSTVPYILEEVSSPPTLISTRHSAPAEVKKSRPRGEAFVLPAHVWIPNAKHRLGAWWWASTGNIRERHRAVLFIHGGPHLRESGGWDTLKAAFSARHYAVIALNYSGSVGYGKSFERRTNLDLQTSDLLAAVEEIEIKAKVLPRDLVIIASSYGTRVLLEALRRNPKLCGTIVFSPFLATDNVAQSSDAIDFEGSVLAFHGACDSISNPESAHTRLWETFSTAASAGRIYWREFPQESHSLSRVASIQEEFGTISCLVETGTCGGSQAP